MSMRRNQQGKCSFSIIEIFIRCISLMSVYSLDKKRSAFKFYDFSLIESGIVPVIATEIDHRESNCGEPVNRLDIRQSCEKRLIPDKDDIDRDSKHSRRSRQPLL